MAETAALPASASVLVMTKESRSGGSEDTGRVPTRCVGRNLVTVRVRVAVLQHEMVVVNIGQSLGTTVADCQTQRRGAHGCSSPRPRATLLAVPRSAIHAIYGFRSWVRALSEPENPRFIRGEPYRMNHPGAARDGAGR